MPLTSTAPGFRGSKSPVAYGGGGAFYGHPHPHPPHPMHHGAAPPSLVVSLPPNAFSSFNSRGQSPSRPPLGLQVNNRHVLGGGKPNGVRVSAGGTAARSFLPSLIFSLSSINHLVVNQKPADNFYDGPAGGVNFVHLHVFFPLPRLGRTRRMISAVMYVHVQ